MHDPTLQTTFYLAGGLILCLLLPLMMTFNGSTPAAARNFRVRTVWTGQIILAVSGLAILVSERMAPYAAVFGLVGYSVCLFVLVRQMRATGPAYI